MNEPLGQRIRRERLALGMSLTGLAIAVGVTKGHVSQVETGKANPGLDVFAAIAEALGISLDRLYYGERSS